MINTNLTDRTTSINNTGLTSQTNFIKPIIVKEKKSPPPLRKIPNERLSQRNSSENRITYTNFLKIIKEIKNSNIKKGFYKKNHIKKHKIPFDTKYEDIVFDANNIIHEYRIKENKKQLKVLDNVMNEFVTKNKQISKNNVLIELILNENKKLKTEKEKRNNILGKSAKDIEIDKINFEKCTSKQNDLYFKLNDILLKIHEKNGELIKLLYYYKTKEKTLEDEIFKTIEQIESIRIYAKFIHKVLGGDVKMFEGELIPNYENDIRPDINILITKVYKKYGKLIKNHRLSLSTNSIFSDEKEKKKNNIELKSEEDTIEEIDIDLLNDPYIIIKKFKELEDKIIRVVQNREVFNKNKIKEDEENKEAIQYLKGRVIELEKEYKIKKNEYINYKKNEFGIISNDMSSEEFNVLANDLCNEINECFNTDKYYKNKDNVNIMNILELNDFIKNSQNIMIKVEGEINNYIERINSYEKKDHKIFSEIIAKKKLEIKIKNQEKVREIINKNEFLKKNKAEEKINKIVIKIRKREPSRYLSKKEIKYKVDVNKIIKKENEELLKYK